ncbi:MAG: DNA repair protein RecO [Acidimicrobiales bacterium]
MALYRDEAVVLRTYKLGEADRIVVLYGRGRGKIRAVAKGVRRTRSKFGSRLEPASIIQVQCHEGRNLDIVTQAERTQPLADLRADLGRVSRAAILLEAIDHSTADGEPEPARYKLLVGALTELDRSGNRLVVPAFVAKLLALDGVQPRVDACVACERADELVALSLHEGGVFCRSHRRGLPIGVDALEALRLVLQGRVRQVLDTTTDETAQELENLAARMIEQHIERRLQSSAVLYEQLDS